MGAGARLAEERGRWADHWHVVDLDQASERLLDSLDPGAVQEAPDVRAVLTAGLQAVVEAATTELPRSVLTGRALRRFDVDIEAADGTGDAERPGAVADAPTAA